MRRTLFCLLFFVQMFVWPNTKELEGFFNATKNYDFKTALLIVDNLEDSILKDRLKFLVSLIIEKTNSDQQNILFDQSSSQTINFLNLLISGYQLYYSTKQEHLKTYKYFSSAIKLSDEIGNKVFTKAALISMLDLFATEIFIGSKQYEPYLNQFMELKSDMTDEVLIIQYNLIFSTTVDDDFDSVSTQYYAYYNKLDSIFINFPKNHSFFATYYYEKGIFYKIDGDFNKAEHFFFKADSVASKNKYANDLKVKIAWQLSHVKMQNNQLVEAKRFLATTRKASTKLKESFYNNRLASLIFQKEGNYDSAYYYLRKSVDIEYELGYKNNTLESSILSVQNQTDKLKLDKLELESSTTRNRNWAILFCVLMVLGSVIGVLANKNTKRKQLLAEQEKALEQQKFSNLLKEKELSIIDAMIRGQERERQRVANELHDDLGSLMAAVKLQFNSLEATGKKGNLDTYKKTESLIDEVYSKIRAIAHANNSGLIAKQGLLQAVNQMAEKVSVASGIDISVHDYGLDARLENSMELTLFRIIQELMANVLKHAGATEMNIHITNHGDTLNILAEDNGKGMMEMKNASVIKGMGLKSIDKRISYLHGTMKIESELGKGTVIILDIPL
jgi:signal transduction histidine kinase